MKTPISKKDTWWGSKERLELLTTIRQYCEEMSAFQLRIVVSFVKELFAV